MLLSPKVDRTPYWVLIASFLYAALRYSVFKDDVGWKHTPLFVTNKAASMAGIILIGLSPLRSTQELRASTGILAFGLLLFHAIASTILLKPEYLKKFFLEDGRLGPWAEVSIFGGITAFVITFLLMVATYSKRPPNAESPSSPYRGWNRCVLTLGILHVVAMSYFTWPKFESWPAYLPPISLLSAIAAAILLVIRFKKHFKPEV